MRIIDVPIIPSSAVDFEINQRATFTVNIELRTADNVAIDITDYTIVGAAKPEYTAPDSEKIFFNIEVTNAEVGEFKLIIPHTATERMSHRIYVYDVVAQYGEKRTRLLEGRLLVRPGVA